MTLLAFGDSLTYGHGLADCCTQDLRAGPQHSRLAWPTLLADRLAMPYRNLASPGASNQRILYHLRHSDAQAGDLVIIMWSFIERTFAPRADRLLDLGPWLDDMRWYYDRYDHAALIYTAGLCMEHAALWCKQRGARLLQISGHPYECAELDDMMLLHFDAYHRDKAVDGLHPGPQSHELLASVLTNLVNSP